MGILRYVNYVLDEHFHQGLVFELLVFLLTLEKQTPTFYIHS